MAQGTAVLRGDEWRQVLADNFNGLAPDLPPASGTAGGAGGASGASGWLAAAMLGDVAAFHVAGAGQVLRRSATLARRQPSDLLKVCIQRSGSATIQQDGREVLLGPGSMAIYDIDQPYAIRLQGDWRCAVIAFPRSALAASRRFIDDVICRPAQVASGPGSVLVPLVASAVTRPGGPGDAGPVRCWPRWRISSARNGRTPSGCRSTPISRRTSPTPACATRPSPTRTTCPDAPCTGCSAAPVRR
jgi:hypothetical protein